MKYILIILTVLLFSSCNTNPSPIESIESLKYNKKQFNNIETIGDTIIAYTEGNQLYYKTNKGQYYNAQIITNTDTTIVTDLYFIISGVILCLTIMVLIIIPFNMD